MELQLGLALPTSNNSFPTKGGLDLSINDFLYRPTDSNNNNKKNTKRSFSKAFEPWLLWNNQPNEDDDDTNRSAAGFTITNKNEEDGLVGWPPIKSWRKETCFHVHGEGGGGGRRIVAANGGGLSTFVKVKMEGVGIARKIDLSLHDNVQTLLRTLMHMFDKCEIDANNYKLTYQDTEGDWLLVNDQDLPWRTFVRSVQRLKLLKRSD